MSIRASEQVTTALELGWPTRAMIGFVGLLSWILGAFATLTGDGGVGAAALIGGGLLASGVAGVGRWPNRLAVSGNQVEWPEVRQTVKTQIEQAEASDSPAETLAQLTLLMQRLDSLARTGHVAHHPAEVYDQAIMAALRRIAPGVRLVRSETRSPDVPDFELVKGSRIVHVETKWRADPETPFHGSTLKRLLERLPQDARLMVIANARDVEPGRAKLTPDQRRRIRMISWADPSDDAELSDALAGLLRP